MTYLWEQWYAEDTIERQLRMAVDIALRYAYLSDDAVVNEQVMALAEEVAKIDAAAKERAELDPSPVEVGRPNLHLIPGGDAS
jgi:predicted RNA-binding protein with EMAP domain